jgi:hypothetical protein
MINTLKIAETGRGLAHIFMIFMTGRLFGDWTHPRQIHQLDFRCPSTKTSPKQLELQQAQSAEKLRLLISP